MDNWAEKVDLRMAVFIAVAVLGVSFGASVVLGKGPGNNAEWMGGIGTTLAFLGAILLLWNEARARAHAELVPAKGVSISCKLDGANPAKPAQGASTASPASSKVKVWIHNGATFPIVQVELFIDPSPQAPEQSFELFSEAGADRRDEHTFSVPAQLADKPKAWVEFTDVYGRRWKKVENEHVVKVSRPDPATVPPS